MGAFLSPLNYVTGMWEFKISVFKIFYLLLFYDYAWSKHLLINPQIRWAYCISYSLYTPIIVGSIQKESRIHLFYFRDQLYVAQMWGWG
jgi:hypothetical protein